MKVNDKGKKPWFLLLVDRPWYIHILAYILLSGLQLLIWWYFGAFNFSNFVQRTAWFFPMFNSYLLISGGLVVRFTLKDFKALMPALEFPDEIEADAYRENFQLPPRRTILISGLVGLIIGLLFLSTSGDFRLMFVEGPHRAVIILINISSVCIFITFLQLYTVLFRNVKAFNRLGKNHARLNLLDTESLTPFARMGIRQTLAIFGSSTFLLLITDMNKVGLIVASMLILPSIVFLIIPMWNIHKRIRKKKRKELETIQRVVNGDNDAMLELNIPKSTSAMSLADLLVYRNEIKHVRAWPINTPLYLRLAFYVFIPPMTWAGASLVDMIIKNMV